MKAVHNQREDGAHRVMRSIFWSWRQKSLIARFGHKEVENTKCSRCNGCKEEKAGVGTEMMHDGTGNDLAERSAHAHCRADGPQREIESA